MKTARFISRAAVIAALYAALTILLAPISYGPVQFRVAEALTVLPAFTAAAIPGLFAGCLIANAYSLVIYGGTAVVDIVFGSLATLLAAFMSYRMPRRWLVPLPPVIVNGVIIGLVLRYILNTPFLFNLAAVSAGQTVVCYGLGFPLMLLLERHKAKIF